jgi:hypothetical protein
MTVLRALASLVMVSAVMGCRTPIEPLHADPAWRPRQGQAVWRPSRDADEIAGEITLLSAPGLDGFLLEFSKPTLSLAQAIRREQSWELATAGRGNRRGRGAAPGMVWFQAGALLTGQPLADGWEGQSDPARSKWWLERPRTGERLEGFLDP